MYQILIKYVLTLFAATQPRLTRPKIVHYLLQLDSYLVKFATQVSKSTHSMNLNRTMIDGSFFFSEECQCH